MSGYLQGIHLHIALGMLIYLLIICKSVASSTRQVACRNEQGQKLDWFYAYKLPKYNKLAPLVNSGLIYMYLSNLNPFAWQFGKFYISNSNSLIGKTLLPVMTNPETFLLAYNDEFPNGTVISKRGHTKGVLASDEYSAIWLIHSVPKFPDIPSNIIPENGRVYAQSFLCLTLHSSHVDTVAKILQINEANIYYYRSSYRFWHYFLEVEHMENSNSTKPDKLFDIVKLPTKQGTNFTVFAKSSYYKKELYGDMIAPTLNVSLLVETWTNGRGTLPSNCSIPERVFNVANIESDEMKVQFASSADHSKWAVAKEESNWICVGDLNRQEHQLKRGGGAVCQFHDGVAQAYRGLISSFLPCPK